LLDPLRRRELDVVDHHVDPVDPVAHVGAGESLCVESSTST
jgi:hypothetical protein